MSKGLKYRFLFVIMMISCAATFVSAQENNDTINQMVDGKKEGYWRIELKSGKVNEGCFVAGKKNGRWKTLRQNGSIESLVTFSKGIPRGLAIYYHKNGKIMEEGYWNVDHWEGTYTRNNESGVRAVEFNYNNEGKREGPQTYYHPNGKVMYTGDWSNGKISGALSMYDEDGVKYMERNYTDGKFQGNAQGDEMSKPKEGSSLETFRGTGQYTLFNSDGTIHKKGIFENGKLMNGYHYIYSKGKQIRTDKYVNGEKR